ncbi:MAG: hypothetical protein RIK87_16050 [Fuerstiella sp.]
MIFVSFILFTIALLAALVEAGDDAGGDMWDAGMVAVIFTVLAAYSFVSGRLMQR